ncbi:MAG TPA: pepsin/retropepsin-like aspartic protease family protein [Longimicrobium sp.]|nr:pepsin/retropepsin-like aspartic protease family protein [Longimicrobium sp.]
MTTTKPFRSSAALLAFLLTASSAAAQAPDTARLAALYEARDCFTLREALAAGPADRAPETAFYRAFVAGAFNRPDESVREAQRYLSWEGSARAPGRRIEAETILAENLVRAHRYGEAADVYARLLPEVADSARRAGFAMAVQVFGALRGVPAQTVALAGEVRVPLTRDKAGLVNVEVAAGDTGERFVFDTGANLSTVTESTARAFGFRIIDRPVEAGTASGRNTAGRLAVAPELKIGAATVRNAVFLVLPDSALAFPQIDYRIHGIVGFPVIAALGEVTLTRAGELVVEPASATAAEGEPNLCLNGLEPLVRVAVGADTLHFGLDTGAQSSTLFPPFHALRRAELEPRGPERTTRLGGAGGSREVRAFDYGPVTLSVGGRAATVERLSVLPERTIERSRFVYGDIGQDVIRQFEAMTLDFRRMRIRFR